MSQVEPCRQIGAPLPVADAADAVDASRTGAAAKGAGSRAVLRATQPPTVEEVTLGQAARRIGVPSDVLRDLCDAGLVACDRRRAGHRYLKTHDVPDRQWIDEQVIRRYQEAVLTAQAAARRVAVELEAITLDLAEAADDSPAHHPLGEDLRRCHELGGSFDAALRDLRDATAEAATAHRRAAALRRLGATSVRGTAASAYSR